MHTLNIPSYNKYWPEDGLIKPKHVAKTMYYWLYIYVVLWLNKILYEYCITQQDGSYQNWGFKWRPTISQIRLITLCDSQLSQHHTVHWLSSSFGAKGLITFCKEMCKKVIWKALCHNFNVHVVFCNSEWSL
jgi:hypothetical protein